MQRKIARKIYRQRFFTVSRLPFIFENACFEFET
jgi:hypothetical protein